MKSNRAMITLLLSLLFLGLMAGLFYSWSVSVMPGITKLNDIQFLSAMQAMNRAILNPLFLIPFIGTVFLLPFATWQQASQPAFYYLLAASVLYIAGVFGVTITGNVPLNDSLDKFNLVNATAEALAAQRRLFETPWVNLHTIRTICGILAFACGLIGLYQAAANK
ncbi:anthrone oxygenase family protein [Chitinophaga jiangningensis]|nr:anthrone oxygenase family protein [Chitinophaga jiangningensis]